MFVKFMLFFLFAFNTQAVTEENKFLNGFDPVHDQLSDDYEAGPYLIYDCQAGHWVCVLESYWDKCSQKRQLEEKEINENLSCIPFEQMPNKKSCFQKQLFMVTQNHGANLCTGKSWVKKNIRL